MSRIFEALNRQPGELAEAALSPLGVNGPAGALTEQAAAPVAKVTEICSSAIRTLPLRIPGAVPVLPFDGDHCKAAREWSPKDQLIGAVLNCVPNWFLGRYSSPYYYGDYGRYGKKS